VSALKGKAWRFVLILGFVSLLSDMTYEGARSITGPFLATLGATGAVIGFVSGLGELVGYGLRLISGYLSDVTKRYWAFTIFGYIVNLFSVPLLYFAGSWPFASSLIIAERVGKAIRTPARDAMLSHAASQLGRGWAFGVHEALDQVGALAGPLIVGLVLYLKGGYREAFAWLAVPAILAVTLLILSKLLYPTPRDLEVKVSSLSYDKLPKSFWLYLGAVSLIAFGYIDYPLLAMHAVKAKVISPSFIPFLYALAMGVDAVAALALGYLFDRFGLYTLALSALISSLFAPLVFFGGLLSLLLGVSLWGIGMGAQESILRAVIGGMVSPERRGSAYGIFNSLYGVSWFMGSALLGFLYDRSVASMVAISVFAQILSIPLILYLAKGRR